MNSMRKVAVCLGCLAVGCKVKGDQRCEFASSSSKAGEATKWETVRSERESKSIT